MLYSCSKCKHTFELNPEMVSQSNGYTCPYCQTHFAFDAPPQADERRDENTEHPNNRTKLCPFCGEEIMATALKCKHCGELLSASNPLYATLNIQPPTDVQPTPQAVYIPVSQPVPVQQPVPTQQPAPMQPVPMQPVPMQPVPMASSNPYLPFQKYYQKVWNGWGTAIFIFFLSAIYIATMAIIARGVDAERGVQWLVPLGGLLCLGILFVVHYTRNRTDNRWWEGMKYGYLFLVLVNGGLITADRRANGPFLVLAIGFAIIAASMFLYKEVNGSQQSPN